MKITRMVIIGAALCLLTIGQQPVAAANRLEISIAPQDFQVDNGPCTRVTLEDAESFSRPGHPTLPLIIRHFRVKTGSLRSVTVEQSGPILLASAVTPADDVNLTTFSGTDILSSSYYADRLAQRDVATGDGAASALLTQYHPRFDSERGQIAVVALEPTKYDRSSGRIFGFKQLIVDFHGSPDLEIEEILASDLSSHPPVLARDQNHEFTKLANSSAPDAAEFVIVTSSEFLDILEPLAKWKRLRGIPTAIISIESIKAQFPGVDAAEQLRNFLIESYQSGVIYTLLAGDETILPVRYAYHENTDEQPPLDLQQLCDLYFADVDGDWDVDGDGVYGEPTHDSPDLTPELLLGRLPFSKAEQFEAYIEKLIQYEENPGRGDHEWLNRSLFVSADQMRDYQQVGQHSLIAEALPQHVTTDMIGMVEAPSGLADNPDAPFATEALGIMNEGWGSLSLLVHGMNDGWVIRSSGYNEWPKSLLFTREGTDGAHGHLPNLAPNDKPGVVYSIGCNNAAFDMDQPPFASTATSVVESFLQRPAGGAVAFVGYTRWGWVTSCWKIEKAFFESLYNDDNNACEALRQAKSQFPYYRDMMYGLGYFGDPTLNVWTDLPLDLQVEYEQFSDTGMVSLQLSAISGDELLSDASLMVFKNDSLLASTTSDVDGGGTLQIDFNLVDAFKVMAIKEGHITASAMLSPGILLDADDDELVLPQEFSLRQNFPNPFNPITTISFSASSSGLLILTVYNILGQEVTTLASEWFSPGRYDVVWNGRDRYDREVASGVYFARLRQGDDFAVIKMTLLK